MRVIKRGPLVEFGRRYPAAVPALDLWYRATLRARWRNFAELRSTFGQADAVRVASGNSVAVFDVGGNKFRLIARISYEKQKVYVLRVLTHKQYDSDRWRIEL